MAQKENLKTNIVIIGAGIAGLSLAFRAGWNGLKTVVLDDGREGTTFAATGIIAPRVDYMFRDIDLVRASDAEIPRFKMMFPEQVVRATRFIIPIDPARKQRFDHIKALLQKYDEITPLRKLYVPKSSFISQGQLELEEPNIRKNAFDGALVLWELTADPKRILDEVEQLNKKFYRSYSRVKIKPESIKFDMRGSDIERVKVSRSDGSLLTIECDTKSLVVVNAAGPWIQDVVALLGINLNIKLYLGVQMSVPGYLFQSGIITFDPTDKYCICLQKGDFLQVGPTNTLFTGHPDNIKISFEDLGHLLLILKSVLCPDIKIDRFRLLKAGLRVKPIFGDTNRPVIWSHRKEGFYNLYTLFPGKMSLGFLAAEELLRITKRDGWFDLSLDTFPKCALEGECSLYNRLFLNVERLRSLSEVGKMMLLG